MRNVNVIENNIFNNNRPRLTSNGLWPEEANLILFYSAWLALSLRSWLSVRETLTLFPRGWLSEAMWNTWSSEGVFNLMTEREKRISYYWENEMLMKLVWPQCQLLVSVSLMCIQCQWRMWLFKCQPSATSFGGANSQRRLRQLKASWPWRWRLAISAIPAAALQALPGIAFFNGATSSQWPSAASGIRLRLKAASVASASAVNESISINNGVMWNEISMAIQWLYNINNINESEKIISIMKM